MEASNVKAMHEALVKIRKLVTDDRPADEVEIANICNIALSAPLRNFDIGTAEEQMERHRAYCNDHEMMCGRSGSVVCRKCFAKWAQMPYEKGGEE